MTTATDFMEAFVVRFAHLGPELAPRALLAFFRSLPIEIRAAIGTAMERDARQAAPQREPAGDGGGA